MNFDSIYNRIILIIFFVLSLLLAKPLLAADLDVCKDAGWDEVGECNQNNCINRVGDVGYIECYGCSANPKTKVCCSKFKDQSNKSILSPRIVGCVDYKINNALYGTTSTPDEVVTNSKPAEFTPQVTIPGSVFTAGKPVTVTGDTLGQYLANFYNFFVALIAIIAVVMIMWGGFKRIMAAGNAESIKGANQTITGALVGLVIALMSYSLLRLINPSLVNFRSLNIQPVTAEQFSFRPAFINNPELQTTADKYKNMACPTQAELISGVKFYVTGYYKPAYGDKEAYQSFECNIAMQCSCPNPPGVSPNKTCKVGNKVWAPCNSFDSSVDYCNSTSAPPVTPVAWQTAAVSSCLPKGTAFKVLGSNLNGVSDRVWLAQDGGGWIKGRRIDLFMGQGSSAYRQAIQATGEVTIKVCSDKDHCPSS